MSAAVRLTLVSRRYCHLCTQMETALAPLAEEFGVGVEVLDVDADPALEARYDERVPVLLHAGVELCHYFLDIPRVRDYLNEIG
ncbi:glutaredoxin family protein [Accumulibacter sp.]|uniref:glutaredoxin family protein n=1 Tax=Accumulibacter sp. TaxID=2053492 RepID=UPI0025E338B9|nr:glutaredoxin family protein [Accumulibacter sp.]MCM8594447.1 glutaredoxin family protein [Accumulibacter sp.]MCM8624917.1 glutaredoxin family protein [Accumulibacter sp.]MDS4048593.1 glutaredoxin family protein [Accumulibacter sp.]